MQALTLQHCNTLRDSDLNMNLCNSMKSHLHSEVEEFQRIKKREHVRFFYMRNALPELALTLY
jgi:hypothetical protein